MIDLSKLGLKVENIVATFYLFTRSNLDDIIAVLQDPSTWEVPVILKHNPRKFSGLVCHLDEPKVTLTLFRTGKGNVTGARSLDDVQAAVSKLVDVLLKSGVRFNRAPEIRVQNIVLTGDLGREFNLDIVASALPNCEYEPEIFPSIIYRVKDPKMVILLFSSGRVVCSGAKSEHRAWEAIKKFLYELEKRNLI